MPRSIGIVTAADSRERSHGQLHIYDGEGKGKSQAALGVVLRTIGLGICEQRQTRVLLLRFLKGPGRAYDEDAAIEALQQGFPHLIDHLRTGRADHFTADDELGFDLPHEDVGTLEHVDPAVDAGISAFAREIERQSMMNGYLSAFYLFSFTAVAILPLLLLIRMPKRHH